MSLFAWVLGLGVAGVGAHAIRESMKPTGEKVRDGDSVFVRADALQATSGQQFDVDALKRFVAGFTNTNVKVSSVVVTGNVKGRASGAIIGAPVPVFFELSAVTSIERDGKRIT